MQLQMALDAKGRRLRMLSSMVQVRALQAVLPCVMVLLMVQKSGDHQLRLVVYPIIYTVLLSQVVQDFSHQQYVLDVIIDSGQSLSEVSLFLTAGHASRRFMNC